MLKNQTRTRLISNDTGSDMFIKFPEDDPSVVGNLQIYVISGVVEFKGTEENKFLGVPCDFVPIPEGQSMNFVNFGNNNPNGDKTIKLENGAVISLIAMD